MRNKKLLLENLRKIPIIQVACAKSGVSRASYYRWYGEDNKFKEEADEALSEGIDKINDLAESKVIENINTGDMRAVMYWLNNHHSSYSYNKVILSNKDKQQIIEGIQNEKLTEVIQMLLCKIASGEIPNSSSRTLINTISSGDKLKDSLENKALAKEFSSAIFGRLGRGKFE